MKTLINILSIPRSGSTLLDAMLGNAEDAFSCGEMYALYRPYRKQHFRPHCSCGEPDCSIWTKLQKVPESQVHQTLFQDMGYDLVVDSSKDISWLEAQYRWLPESVPIVNITIYKDPIQLCYSGWKRGQNQITDKQSLINLFIKYYKRFLKLKIPFISVHYSSFIKNQADHLDSISKLIGIPFQSGRERFWETESHLLYGSKSIQEQIYNRAPRNYDSEKYSKEFLKFYDTIKLNIESNHELSEIISKLEQNRVDRISIFENFRPKIPVNVPISILRKLRRTYKKHFPEDYDIIDVYVI